MPERDLTVPCAAGRHRVLCPAGAASGPRTADVELQVPSVNFRAALALDAVQQGLELERAAHRRRTQPPGLRQIQILQRLASR